MDSWYRDRKRKKKKFSQSFPFLFFLSFLHSPPFPLCCFRVRYKVVVPFWNTGSNVRAEESLEGNKKRTRELRKNFKVILYSDIHS